MSEELYSLIPGLREAVEKEKFIRQAAFCGLPEIIEGIKVSPLAPRHLVILESIDSPFTSGRIPVPREVEECIWVLAECRFASRAKRWLFHHRLRKKNYNATLQALYDYFDESFQDAPSGRSSKSGISYYSFSAALVDVFASEYGWGMEEIFNSPVKQLFQFLKIIRRRANPSVPLFNPSDSIRSRWLAEMNRNPPNN